MAAELPVAGSSPLITVTRAMSTRTAAANSGTVTSAISSAVVTTSRTVPIRRPTSTSRARRCWARWRSEMSKASSQTPNTCPFASWSR
ncbi:hypothetical protein SCYAM73S_04879 [Streptomyces cyaneofuscatus]